MALAATVEEEIACYDWFVCAGYSGVGDRVVDSAWTAIAGSVVCEDTFLLNRKWNEYEKECFAFGLLQLIEGINPSAIERFLLKIWSYLFH